MAEVAPKTRAGWAMVVPALRWMRECNAKGLAGDMVAGFTLAAYMLPAGIGDASLAGLPAQAGLYACMFAGLVFWLFCASRQTVVTVTSAISLLLGTSLGAMSGGDPARHAALAAATALLAAGIALLAWLFRAGNLVTFISETVLIGFKAGVALTLASTQIPKLMGLKSHHGGGVLSSFGRTIAEAGEANRASVAVGLAALAALVLGKLYLKHRPVALFVVIGGIVASSMLGLEARGVRLLGAIPAGLPTPGLPMVGADDLNELLPLAMACFLLAAVETSAIGRMSATRAGVRFDANQELLALAAANLASGLGRGYPVSGGVSQSLVNQTSGARTPVSGLFAALLILIVAVFFSGLLRELPQPVLAAIVLSAVMGLVKVEALQHLWKTDRQEFLVAVAALAGVLTSGLLRGVLIGAVISIVLLIRHASRPHVAVLGRIPGSRRFSDRERHPDNETVPGVEVFRVESGLLYFNADHVQDRVMRVVDASGPKLVVFDLSATPYVDLAGAEMLMGLHAELTARGTRLAVVEARSGGQRSAAGSRVRGSVRPDRSVYDRGRRGGFLEG
jgi:SulP family sulfate permease